MPVLSFRFKLLAAMMLVVMGVTGVTIFVAQSRMQLAYEKLFQQQFRSQIDFFQGMQEARLARIKDRSQEMVRSVRIIAAMEEGDEELLYQTGGDELRELLRPSPQNRGMGVRAKLFRFLTPDGEELIPPAAKGRENQTAIASSRRMKVMFKQVAKAMEGDEPQQVGYLQQRFRTGSQLLEVVVTKIVLEDEFDEDAEGEYLGILVLGFPMTQGNSRAMERFSNIQSGIWLDGDFHTETMDTNVVNSVTQAVTQGVNGGKANQGIAPLKVGNVPHQIFFQRMNVDSRFPPAYQVSLYSMADSIRDQKNLRVRILAFGGIVLMAGLVMSLLLANSFSGPIKKLVEGTHEIQQGNFEVRVPVNSRDEVGRLAESFNEMAEGLAQKQKYQDVLKMVADKDIAEEMMSGNVQLGGELRDMSVLFCDIRGFTAMTQGMPPKEVIELMNTHFTALTNVVYEHDGVVDKFVGDLIMGVFGAPRSYGNDAHNAARAALRMIQERNRINETAEQPITVGIGIASGEAVAGCMGSSDRLNYTVMGARVNLASRLCSVAGINEVVIDDLTHDKLKEFINAEELPELHVKGFSDAIRAYKLKEIRSLPEDEDSEPA